LIYQANRDLTNTGGSALRRHGGSSGGRDRGSCYATSACSLQTLGEACTDAKGRTLFCRSTKSSASSSKKNPYEWTKVKRQHKSGGIEPVTIAMMTDKVNRVQPEGRRVVVNMSTRYGIRARWYYRKSETNIESVSDYWKKKTGQIWPKDHFLPVSSESQELPVPPSLGWGVSRDLFLTLDDGTTVSAAVQPTTMPTYAGDVDSIRISPYLEIKNKLEWAYRTYAYKYLYLRSADGNVLTRDTVLQLVFTKRPVSTAGHDWHAHRDHHHRGGGGGRKIRNDRS
jgi:hypothetical protein